MRQSETAGWEEGSRPKLRRLKVTDWAAGQPPTGLVIGMGPVSRGGRERGSVKGRALRRRRRGRKRGREETGIV